MQPLTRQTFYKQRHPLRVLGESLIVNFQKSASRKIVEPVSLPLANVVKNAAERAIVRAGGATTEEVLREVVPELFEANLFIDAASKNMGDILAILESDFDQVNSLWTIKEGRKIGEFIPTKDRIKYYVVSYLRSHEKTDFDDIVTTILPLLINGHEPSKEDILSVLREVAISRDGVTWELGSPSQVGFQVEMPLLTTEVQPDIPATSPHNQSIFRLAILCRKAHLSACIGKQEREDSALTKVNQLSFLKMNADSIQTKRIEQIDIIWADNNGKPVWAFEVEESTSILSALERFHALLAVEPNLGEYRRLTVLAPKSRRRKLYQELASSSYIGHPIFLENKLTYLFTEDLENAFQRLVKRNSITLVDLERYCSLPPSQ